jgi:flagellar biosynthesis/type III secretory pathway protein FliH
MPIIRHEDFDKQRESKEKSALQLALEEDHEARVKEAIESGRRNGFNMGLLEARAQLSNTIASLSSVDDALEIALEKAVLRLVAECLERIAGEDVQTETTRCIVKNVIKSSITDCPSVLLVSREDAKIMRDFLDDENVIELKVDNSLSEGDIIMVSPLGRRRLGLRGQVATIMRALNVRTDER